MEEKTKPSVSQVPLRVASKKKYMGDEEEGEEEEGEEGEADEADDTRLWCESMGAPHAGIKL